MIQCTNEGKCKRSPENGEQLFCSYSSPDLQAEKTPLCEVKIKSRGRKVDGSSGTPPS